MQTNKFRAVACTALCAAALAFAPARADEKTEQAPLKTPAIIRLAPGVDPVDTAHRLRKLMSAEMLIVPVPFSDVLLVYATENEVRELRQIVRPL